MTDPSSPRPSKGEITDAPTPVIANTTSPVQSAPPGAPLAPSLAPVKDEPSLELPLNGHGNSPKNGKSTLDNNGVEKNGKTESAGEEKDSMEEDKQEENNVDEAPPLAQESAPAADDDEKPIKPALSQEEEDNLKHAFDGASPKGENASTGSHSTFSVVEDTPQADQCLRILQKFIEKTSPFVLKQYGGTQGRSLLSYVWQDHSQAKLFDKYENLKDDDAKIALATFVDIFGTWSHASASLETKKQLQNMARLLIPMLEAASSLVEYGCLEVPVTIGEETHPISHMIANSLFNVDLSLPEVEVAVIKLLLGMGCRPGLLRGSHLLQSIRSLYHIYLTTENSPNKVTARAALQQLVTNVFVRTTAMTELFEEYEGFPSVNHRDAYLVLRSLCKLSMRNLPGSSNQHSHIGLQASASNETWGGEEQPHQKFERTEHSASLVSTGAVHPALESKLLALELILYVLQNCDFGLSFLEQCGPQFHAAIRNYLCVSLLKNCTDSNFEIVNCSLRIFVPVVRYFRTILKSEIEAFVTNVFFVILDSKNSNIEHKSLVVCTFEEICSDPRTLAEIFLNYDCDLSAVDLFHRIVNALSRLSRTPEPSNRGWGNQEEKFRIETRELRLDAMRALRQILASLHASIVEPLQKEKEATTTSTSPPKSPRSPSQNLVEIYGSKKKRRAEESEAVLRFNQKPSAGIAYAAKCKHIDAEDPADVARYLLKNKDEFEKTQIGEYLGREAEYQNGFSLRVLHEYVRLMDFENLVFDDAIRYFLSGFRLPGEAQKIDRIMEKFAERFTEQNPTVFPSADVAFILSFSIIMLNTDLHNPAIKEERRMTKEGFVRNNRGICDGQDLPEELLTSIFDRIKSSPISLKEDDEARERAGDSTKKSSVPGLPAALSPASFFQSHYDDEDRARENSFQKERDHIVRTTESLLKRRRHSTVDQKGPARQQRGKISRHFSKFVLSEDSGLKDEYVAPMFEVTWGPALAAFSTAMESANGTAGALIAIASDEELELAAENAAETIEVCLTGFRFAIGTAGLCGNSIARDAYMLALSRFSQLGTSVLLEPRHIRCVQTLLSLAREDGELLGGSWEHVFRALSEINRFHQLFHLMARNDRAAALAAERRRRRLAEKERKRTIREQRKAAAEDGESITSDANYYSDESSEDDDSLAESGLFTDDSDEFDLEENMDAKAIDEANAREIYDAVSEATIEAIYERSSSLSANAVKEFIVQLCFVSRAEISVGNNDATGTDLTQVSYRQKHALLHGNSHAAGEQFHHTQPNIYNLQKLVEATHYNMASRPRLLFAELWVTVADHLTYTALHSNPAVAMYAVDSFRQLSIQYLQREELEVFEFQRRFLKPLESVMARSVHVSTKELLLNCVSRLMHVFGSTKRDDSSTTPRNGLRSGWVPILAILGVGGCDKDEGIAKLSFKILSDEIKLCLEDDKHPDVLLSEYFVETANALLSIASGPHDEVCLSAIAQIVLLADSLAAGQFVCSTRRRAHQNPGSEYADDDPSKQKLGLWWPVLLGLSRLVGDARLDIRSKSLEALFGIINRHFFHADGLSDESVWETLQLIFRGILSSILEYAEISAESESAPGLPEDFEMFLSDERKDSEGAPDMRDSSSWLETTFESFLDECIGLCLRSLSYSTDSPLIEEVFAILNNSLISDSGALAVRGLRRLEQFVTSDLDSAALTDDVWATVSHMLQRCLSVRGLPKKKSKSEGLSEEAKKELEAEYEQEVKEFIAEDSFFPHRRYIGSNATNVIGLLLCSDRFPIALRWRLFLVKWLHRGVREWDLAADLLPPAGKKSSGQAARLPDYYETAVYGRKWINRLILQLASVKEIAEAPSDGDPKTNRFVQAQRQVIESTEALLLSFVQKELAATEYRHSKADEKSYKRYTALVHELLAGYGSMDADYLKKIAWINPVLLSSCIRSKNEEVRLMVQKLVEKTSPVSAPPPPKSSDTEATHPTSNAVKEATSKPDNEVEKQPPISTDETPPPLANGTADQ